jgi:DNA-binding NarL/FixJ family response regulator
MKNNERTQLLNRFQVHSARFDAIAAARRGPAPVPAPPASTAWAQDIIVKPSPRELEVLQRISNGSQNRVIALDLFVSVETVKSHVRQILNKTHTATRAHAVAVGIRSGYID